MAVSLPRGHCPGFTTGFTFELDEPNPIYNVYVLAKMYGAGFEDILLPAGYGDPIAGFVPPGFTVPPGTSNWELEQYLPPYYGDIAFAVVGTFIWDVDGQKHPVIGTGEDLTGVDFMDVWAGYFSDYGINPGAFVGYLESGVGIYMWHMAEALRSRYEDTGAGMAPFSTVGGPISEIQLFFFIPSSSEEYGEPLEATVSVNVFGNPEPPGIPPSPIPEFSLSVAVVTSIGTAVYLLNKRRLR